MKKGFTLIELLAVIVILAIIAIIASPIIIGLIDDARKESFKSSAYGIIKAGEILYSNDMMNGTTEEVTFTYTNGVETSTEEKILDYKGSKPNSGEVRINENGEVALAIYNGTYCAEKSYSDTEVKISSISKEDCILISLPNSGVCGDIYVDDRDSEKYETVKIGRQCWMAEDLRYDCVKAGKGYNNVGSVDAWSGTNNCGNQESKYNGLIYQWTTAMNWDGVNPSTIGELEGTQGLCPSGWHIPTEGEWTTLNDYIGTEPGTKLKAKTPIWNGTDDYGFNALPVGSRNTGGKINSDDTGGCWWTSSTEESMSMYWGRYLATGSSTVEHCGFNSSLGFSIRCILEQ